MDLWIWMLIMHSGKHQNTQNWLVRYAKAGWDILLYAKSKHNEKLPLPLRQVLKDEVGSPEPAAVSLHGMLVRQQPHLTVLFLGMLCFLVWHCAWPAATWVLSRKDSISFCQVFPCCRQTVVDWHLSGKSLALKPQRICALLLLACCLYSHKPSWNVLPIISEGEKSSALSQLETLILTCSWRTLRHWIHCCGKGENVDSWFCSSDFKRLKSGLQNAKTNFLGKELENVVLPAKFRKTNKPTNKTKKKTQIKITCWKVFSV